MTYTGRASHYFRTTADHVPSVPKPNQCITSLQIAQALQSPGPWNSISMDSREAPPFGYTSILVMLIIFQAAIVYSDHELYILALAQLLRSPCLLQAWCSTMSQTTHGIISHYFCSLGMALNRTALHFEISPQSETDKLEQTIDLRQYLQVYCNYCSTMVQTPPLAEFAYNNTLSVPMAFHLSLPTRLPPKHLSPWTWPCIGTCQVSSMTWWAAQQLWLPHCWSSCRYQACWFPTNPCSGFKMGSGLCLRPNFYIPGLPRNSPTISWTYEGPGTASTHSSTLWLLTALSHTPVFQSPCWEPTTTQSDCVQPLSMGFPICKEQGVWDWQWKRHHEWSSRKSAQRGLSWKRMGSDECIIKREE